MAVEIEKSVDSHPLCRLPREDLELVAELVLASGSLKGVAEAYGVSYPTIRGRVDRVIERLRMVLEDRKPDPVTDLLADLVARGELTGATARRIRDAVREARAAERKEGDT
ncbi:MAG TPA: DUF2089 family protein [Phycisphaerales bacterium]|nr:DUF2089 family protein [Phycisphaerales bacterium]